MASRSYIPCPQWRVVNLLQERGVGGDLVRDANWFVGTDEFHKRFLFRVDCSRSRQELGAIATRRLKRPPRCARLGGSGLDLEIALSGVSARLSPWTGF